MTDSQPNDFSSYRSSLEHAVSSNRLGNERYNAKEYRNALKMYTDAINADPKTASYYCNRSACHIKLSNYQLAIRDAKLAIQVDPKFQKSHSRLVECYILLGERACAAQALRKLEKLNRSSESFRRKRQTLLQLRQLEKNAQSFYGTYSFDSALYCLDHALQISPACIRYLLMKGECLAFTNRCYEALNIANSIIKLDSVSADATYLRGLCLYYTDSIDKGITSFALAIQLDPAHKKAKEMQKKAKKLKQTKEYGNKLFSSGDFPAALTTYSDALQIDEFNKIVNAKLFYNRALVNSKIGSTADVIADCTKALQMNEKYLKALLLRARCYRDLKQFDECLADYMAALEMENSDELRKMLNDVKGKLKFKNFYRILDIARNATDDEIKRAYRNKALIHHPDRHANSNLEVRQSEEIKFKEVGEAYATLTDPHKKLRYDKEYDEL